MSTNIESATVNIEQMLSKVTQELDGLRLKGNHGHLDQNEPKSLRDQFCKNFSEFERCQNRLYHQKNTPKIKEQLQFEMQNLKGILARQITTGLYKEPTSNYLKKVQQQKQLAQELQKLTGKTIPLETDNEINLIFNDLLNDMIMGAEGKSVHEGK